MAGKGAYIDAVRSYASGFIFTTAPPPCNMAAAAASVQSWIIKFKVENEKLDFGFYFCLCAELIIGKTVCSEFDTIVESERETNTNLRYTAE